MLRRGILRQKTQSRTSSMNMELRSGVRRVTFEVESPSQVGPNKTNFKDFNLSVGLFHVNILLVFLIRLG